jgi:hypothetical protein
MSVVFLVPGASVFHPPSDISLRCGDPTLWPIASFRVAKKSEHFLPLLKREFLLHKTLSRNMAAN